MQTAKTLYTDARFAGHMAGEVAPIIAMVNKPMGNMAQEAGWVADRMPQFNLQMLNNATAAAVPVQVVQIKSKDLKELIKDQLEEKKERAMCREIQLVVRFCENNPQVCSTVLANRIHRHIQTLKDIKEIDKFWSEECLKKFPDMAEWNFTPEQMRAGKVAIAPTAAYTYTPGAGDYTYSASTGQYSYTPGAGDYTYTPTTNTETAYTPNEYSYTPAAPTDMTYTPTSYPDTTYTQPVVIDQMAMTPVEMAPAQMAPVEMAPVEMAPAQMAPVQMAPVEMAPAQMAPIEMAPAQMAPVEMAPVEMAPVEMAPAQMAPVDMTKMGMFPEIMAPKMPAEVVPETTAPAMTLEVAPETIMANQAMQMPVQILLI